MNLRIQNLKLLIELMVNKIKKRQQNINLNLDYYWVILPYEAFKITKIPQPAIGSLVDDWQELLKVSTAENPFTVLDIDRLAHLLFAIGYNFIRPESPLTIETVSIEISEIELLFDLFSKKLKE